VATIYIVQAAEDAELIQKDLLSYLPSSGYDHWLARHHLPVTSYDEPALVRAMEQCQAVLAVLSPSLLRAPALVTEIGVALGARSALVVVQTGALPEQDAEQVPAQLWSAPQIDLSRQEPDESARLLTALLPTADAESSVPPGAERIDWNEEIFSQALAAATGRHDSARADALVEAAVRHLRSRPYPYPTGPAIEDLQRLRQDRAFDLMRRYAESLIESGIRQDKVRRLFAQALIELSDYDRALQELASIIDDRQSSEFEVFEAHGLIGRVYKQRYVDAPDRQAAAGLLEQAIASYEAIYLRDQSQFWHGTNASSCMLRAERDQVPVRPPDLPRKFARQIVDDINLLSKQKPLPVWDCASRVEALIALERYDDAEEALDAYINHPEMMAFEVSSTFRQFDQVLELGRRQPGQQILDRLRAAVERYRAGNLRNRMAPASTAGELPFTPFGTRSLVLRVSDPWDSSGIPDFVPGAQLGNVVTATGSEATVRALLADSRVISVDESRPVGRTECERSLPFIKTSAEYSGVVGPYKETGDQALIAVIDDGIDVLHPAFLDSDGHSRIVGIWHQSASGGPPPEDFNYGVFHDATAIAGYVKTGSVPPELGRDYNGHGTHVTSIAGGRRTEFFAGGVAPDAKLLIVISDARGQRGYVSSHLDALRFIDDTAKRLDLPVVVNVSQGMNAGAHDGKSLLEGAFDWFSKSNHEPGRVVVKSAGNEREKGGHAKITVPSGSIEELGWKRESGADYAEWIELWWSSADEMEFRICDPGGNWSEWVKTSQPTWEQARPDAGPVSLELTKRHVDNGDSRLLIELGNETASAALGQWRLEIISGVVPKGGEIHAWIERSQGTATSFTNHNDEEMTLSIPGTAANVITVGAVDASMPVRVGTFSSYGPTRDKREQPMVCAPGLNVRAAHGGDDEVTVKSGTSMAAPHVAGAIALVFSRAHKASRSINGQQVAAALCQKTQNYAGQWDRGRGYGVIDVAALLAAFE
jgi:subtilisin family serine protease/tetratricopeptide (TPR) repeat protein